MLTSLRITNVVLIDKLEIAFASGFCALTGETGAGKSILLDSLGLSLGARSEARLVKKGADQASVTAVFEIEKTHPAFDILQESDIECDVSEPLILRRSIGQDGRSKAFVNDQAVSVSLLRDVGDTLVEIHGQFETQGLLNPSTHRQMLDDYAAFDTDISGLWDSWQQARVEYETLKADLKKARAEEDFLRQAVEDLDALSPKDGEEAELSSLRDRLMHREKVLEGLNAAFEYLNRDDDPVRSAWAALDKISDKLGDAAQDAIGALDRATAEVEEARASIQALSADLEESEHDFQSIDDRLFSLRAQARKHQCTVDELPALRERLAQQLDRIEKNDEVLEQASKAVEAARQAYKDEAGKVSELRTAAAAKLDKLVVQELPPLKLDKAKFVTVVEELDEADWGPHGADKVRFLVSTNPGAEPGPLNKIASGGEMARFMLALKVIMAEVGAAGSLVFDEVDTGIGGSTADAVGERLAKLAKSKQVLVVTHAPQVAARAGHHFIVRKDGAQEVTTNVVSLSTRQERCEEIARMLSGASVTQEARAAAEKLLETGT